MRSLFAISKYTLLETIRNKTFYIGIVFSFILLLISKLAGSLSFNQQSRAIFDFSLAGLNLLLVFLSFYMVFFLYYKEQESRSLLLYLSKPISRSNFLLGKYLGYVASSLFILLMSVFLLMIYFYFYSIPIGMHLFFSVCGIFMDVLLLMSILFLFSTITNHFLSLLYSFGFWLICHSHVGLGYLQKSLDDFIISMVYYLVSFISPDLSFWNWKDKFYIVQEVSYIHLLESFAYATLWSMFYLSIATLVFRRKDCV